MLSFPAGFLGYILHQLTLLLIPFNAGVARVNPNVKYELWVAMFCLYRFMNCDRRTNLKGEGDNGRSDACWGGWEGGI